MGHWQGPPGAGLVASAMAEVMQSWFSQLGQSWFCQSGQTDLHPIGGLDVLENFFIWKGDQWLHCPPELQYIPCQKVRLTRDLWLGLLQPVLKGLCIGEGHLWLCKPVVLTAKLWIWRWHKLVFLQGRGAGGVEWSLSTSNTWLHTFGSSNDALTYCANSQCSSWPATSHNPHHQAGMSTCWAFHGIHFAFSMGEGLGSLGIKVHGRSSSTPVLAGNVSSPLKSSWRWGSSERGHSSSSSPPSTLSQSESSHIVPSIPQVSWGIW